MYKVLIKCRQPAKNWLLRVLSRLLFWELQKGAKDKVRNHRLLLHPSHPLDKENSFIISTQLRGNRRWVPPVNMCPFLSVLTFYFYWLLWYLGFYIAESFLEILVGTIKLKLGLHCYTDSPAVIDQKYGELFTFMIKAWNFARLQPTLRLTFLDMEPSQIQHWTRVLRRP